MKGKEPVVFAADGAFEPVKLPGGRGDAVAFFQQQLGDLESESA